MVYIYILKLEKNKFYVGKTNNPYFRLENHFSQNGSAWTNKYRPIKVLELIPNCDDYDENKYTEIYMKNYGIENVRGGSYVQLNLNENTQKHLERNIRGTSDKCFRCGRSNHFVSDCYAKTDINGNIISESESESESESDCCFRCGREGHYINNCYAKYDINGTKIKN